jgi:hypothetical protein
MRANQDDLMTENILQLANAKYFDGNMAAHIFKIYGQTEAAQEEVATA